MDTSGKASPWCWKSSPEEKRKRRCQIDIISSRIYHHCIINTIKIQSSVFDDQRVINFSTRSCTQCTWDVGEWIVEFLLKWVENEFSDRCGSLSAGLLVQRIACRTLNAAPFCVSDPNISWGTCSTVNIAAWSAFCTCTMTHLTIVTVLDVIPISTGITMNVSTSKWCSCQCVRG